MVRFGVIGVIGVIGAGDFGRFAAFVVLICVSKGRPGVRLRRNSRRVHLIAPLPSTIRRLARECGSGIRRANRFAPCDVVS